MGTPVLCKAQTLLFWLTTQRHRPGYGLHLLRVWPQGPCPSGVSAVDRHAPRGTQPTTTSTPSLLTASRPPTLHLSKSKLNYKPHTPTRRSTRLSSYAVRT